MKYNDVVFGQNVVIGENVKIGKGTIIGHNVVIHNDTIIGENVRVDDNTVLGKNLMKAANSAVTKEQQLDPLTIGDSCLIGACVVLYRGVKIGNKVLIADQAAVQFKSIVGDFTIVGRGVLVESSCSIGSRVKLESGTYITAYSTIEDYCFIAPNVSTSNDNFAGRSEQRFDKFKGVTVKRGGRIGVNATILPGIVIEEDAMVAAGSVVTRNVQKGKVVAGVPAKEFCDVPEDQLLVNNIKV
ncbi:MAG: N-acetyltransferase [Candidatus Delongbacteria bacterium]|nr:N-acetyltransferase [Candidatus Delongbacteria bacterium]MBN2834497.1 N-acetyltransferase [Candidatus Delongbacteria bacterium]